MLLFKPLLLYRADNRVLRSCNRGDRPGEYIADDEATEMISVEGLIERADLENGVICRSDRSHQDFDAPAAVENVEGLTEERRIRTFEDNARELFGL